MISFYPRNRYRGVSRHESSPSSWLIDCSTVHTRTYTRARERATSRIFPRMYDLQTTFAHSQRNETSRNLFPFTLGSRDGKKESIVDNAYVRGLVFQHIYIYICAPGSTECPMDVKKISLGYRNVLKTCALSGMHVHARGLVNADHDTPRS